MKYYVDIPYPEIRVEKPNIEYAKVLSNIYAGEISEESCINLYIFEHIALFNTYEEYSEILKRIAIVEMHHLQMLGETIKLLGMKPILMNYNSEKKGFIPWKSNYIDYNTNIEDVIDLDIKSEKKAIEVYKNIFEIVKDKYVRNLITRIIMDEELHLKIFNDFKNKIKIQ